MTDEPFQVQEFQTLAYWVGPAVRPYRRGPSLRTCLAVGRDSQARRMFAWGSLNRDAPCGPLDVGGSRLHGPPLFLKRDNGANHNGPEVAAALAEWRVMPLNSPVAYPQYNGGVERAQDEIRAELRGRDMPAPFD